MNNRPSTVIHILDAASAAQKEGVRRVLSFLPTSRITQIFVSDDASNRKSFFFLLTNVAVIVREHARKRCITDWPFQHFWGNPSEPQHTQLIAYFIDPNQGHDCGAQLLKSLFTNLGIGDVPTNGCKVIPEFAVNYDGKRGFIDILIIRETADRRYGVIFENKVNFAGDTEAQLWKYVGHLKKTKALTEIYVFYVPRLEGKKPSADSVGDIEKDLAVRLFKVKTFETDILRWLSEACSCEGIREGMRDNLKHYKNLLIYLIKEQKMKKQILEQLKLAAGKGKLPTWDDVQLAEESLSNLRECLQPVLRAKLLLRIQDILNRKGEKTEWYVTDGGRGTAERCTIESEFDERFGDSIDLCIPTNEAICVCLNAYTDGFYIGYLRTGPEERWKEYEALVIDVANRWCGDSTGCVNRPYYKYRYVEGIPYESCDKDSTACRLADQLLEMRDALNARISNPVRV